MNNPEDPENMVRRLSKYIEWEESTCHFFYFAEPLENISAKDQAKSFEFFINHHLGNAKLEELSELHDKFKSLSHEEKQKYFSTDTINIIDCRNVDTNNINTYLYLYDFSKSEKKVFVYYTTKEKLRDYLGGTQQYQLRTATFDEADKEIYGFYQYVQLKEEIEKNNINKQEKAIRKPKL